MSLNINSATWLGDSARGSVVVCGSHGGLYPAYLAARAGVRAVILSDAGGGLDNAGIAGLDLLAHLGIAAVALSVQTARIGDADDMAANGRASHVNAIAADLGCEAGMACADLVRRLEKAPLVRADPPDYAEARILLPSKPVPLCLLDSISLVEPEDAGAIVISGSHGGLIGPPRTAVKVDVLAAVYHDAGGGIGGAGFSRLPALDALGIIGATVDGATARIGDARSVWRTGIVSHCNVHGQAAGIATGMSVAAVTAMLGAGGATALEAQFGNHASDEGTCP